MFVSTFIRQGVRGIRRRSILLAGIFLVICPASLLAQEESGEQSWTGKWNNRRYGTSGPLKCTLISKGEKTWEAEFAGKFRDKPFSYKASFTAEEKSGRMILKGESTISGDPYRWTGYVRDNVLFGKFRSAKGHNGTFRLQEPKDD